MVAVRIGLVVIAVVLAGCNNKPPESNATANAAGRQEPVLDGIHTAKPAETPESLAEKRAKLESHLKLAQQSVARGELDGAIRLLEEAVLFDAHHRTVLLLLTQCLQTRSKELAAVDPRRAYGLMVQSGGYLRALRRAHHDFSIEEQEIIANVLYDEACAHARSNRQEETTGSLHAAIDAGFDDLERLDSEPDFEQFRQVPAMANLFVEAASRIESRATEQARNILAASRTSEIDVSRLGAQGPPIDFATSQGRVLVVLVANPQDERQEQIREQLLRVKSRLSSPDLEIKQLGPDEIALTRLPGALAPPAILFIDRGGKLRLVLHGTRSTALLAAICREIMASSS